MVEPTCVIHPFSYNIQEETPFCKNGEGEEGSVSFGRFMSENLAWERWSSFNSNRNRYVEEAEKYSRPGSVAQKKAYFEAHFKRMAALKAAALLESSVPGIGIETGVDSENVVNIEIVEGGSNDGVEGFVVHQNELYSQDLGEKMVGKSDVSKEEEEDCMESNNKLSESVIPQVEKPSMQKTSLKVSTQEQQLPKSVPLLHCIEQVSTPILKKNSPLSSFMSPIDKGVTHLFVPSPVKPTTSAIHQGKENYATPMKNKSSSTTCDQDHKKRTPLRASINREFNRIMSPVIRKIGSSSLSRTPSKGPPPFTPDVTKRGARSHHDSSDCEKKPAGPRWHLLSESISGGFKSPSSNKNKTSSPIIPTSFCLGGGERATRRKQNLEDKFNATTTEKVPQPSKFKEKAEAELNKFRQSFCFKVMSSNDHYREVELQYKNESTSRDCESPRRLGKQQSSSTSQSRSSLPPRRPTVKPSSLKTVTERNSTSNK